MSARDNSLEIRLFGPLRVIASGVDVSLKRRQVRAVLARLALTPCTVIPADALIDAVWGSELPADPRHTVQVYVSRLRSTHVLLRDAVVTHHGGYELSLESNAVDVTRFENLVESAAQSRDRVGELAVAALESWSGYPLLEFAYEEFAQTWIRRLQRRRREAMILGAQAAASGDGSPLEWARIIENHLDESPVDSGLWEALVACYEAVGGRNGSLDARWRRDRALAEAGVVRPPLPRKPRIDAAPGLIDRDREIEEIKASLTISRLVTLVGPPGAGKTRLATHLAATHEGAAALVSLADHSTVAEAIGAGLGIPLAPGPPALESMARYTAPDTMLVVLDNCESVANDVARYLQSALKLSPGLRFLATSRLPLHMPAELTYPIGGLATEVEHDLVLSPAAELLSVRLASNEPDIEALNGLAQRLDGIPLAIEIVAARMKGLPTESIDSRIRDHTALTSTQIRGVDARHASLRAALDSSVSMLDDGTALTFRRLSRFTSSFSRHDAVDVVPELDGPSLQAALDTLVEGSLIEHADSRYRMLWVIAAYGRTLAPDDSAADRTLHAKLMCDRVGRLTRQLHTLEGVGAHDKLGRMSSDIRDALEWALESDPAVACRIAGDLVWHWHCRGDWADRIAYLGRLRQAAVEVDHRTRLLVDWTEMVLSFDAREIRRALELARQIAHDAAALGSRDLEATAEAMIAAASSVTGQRDDGLAAAQRAHVAAEDANDPFVKAIVRFSEASIHFNSSTHQHGVELCRTIVNAPDPDPLLWASAAFVVGREERRAQHLDLAEDLITRSTELLDTMKEPIFRPFAYIELAMLHRRLGRYPSASHHLIATLDDAMRRGDSIVMTPSVDAMALLARDLGDDGTAVALASAAARMRNEAPWAVNPWDLHEADALLSDLSGSMGADDYRRHARHGAALTDFDVLELARSTLG